MLLNLSNHPSARWSDEQQAVARAAYGAVQDMPFPAVDPHWTRDQVEQLADMYLGDILRMSPWPTAVHLMGELTFCFALTRKLEAAGIPCVASTSERQVVDLGEGRKEAQFRFVRFRPYF